ncbi:FMN-dependent NADH-azoreductase [Acinetobacter pittii]|uniref:FMN-dependent NADH-azoreductase n=1 Tax=Acinetobacter pittii TaxID=48296 RepID=UPI000709E792|nr:NAD(P)H-dependent oxidoreductase [Acinetobacter pittii]KRI54454.1 FMN-dependent NADH-azoreductase [Acinetobacter pittii]MCU4401326.1 NAD(P)H-dependent oxidoreductase [Acinetobacter pittii]MCU4404982.1 NAD(P)H-dependent oxidoreductase [Acinetobacter pittii]MCU4464809.1 NAD(P)H-dependent oxidoreductase [Acinetobacter pittii]
MSTRSENSQSLLIAEQVITQLKIKHADLVIDEFNLFEDDLPAFDKNAVAAKMTLFTGQDSNSKEKEAWTKIKEVYDRFASADIYVFNVPLWNNNISYILKQFIDVITQPGWAFGFDPSTGYAGLLDNKKAYVVIASGVYYQGISNNFGSDFATPYLNNWLKFIGVSDIENIHISPTVVNTDYEKTKQDVMSNVEKLIT